MNPQILRINHTLKLLCSCWNSAENILQNEIKTRFPDEDEVMITKLFAADLRTEFERENEKNSFARAYHDDLRESFKFIDSEVNYSSRISSDLIAEVQLHKPMTERKTGGDLGFVIQRPNFFVRNSYNTHSLLETIPKY